MMARLGHSAAAMALAAGLIVGDRLVSAQEDEAFERPDWRGIWIVEGLVTEISGLDESAARGTGTPFIPLLAPFAVAPMTAEGRSRWEAQIQRASTTVKQQGWGYPMMMSGPAPIQFLITEHETLILNSNRDVRHIYTDGRGLPAEEDRWPTVWGESAGRWERDTLVIETVSVEEPSRYAFFSAPVSNQAVYTERIRKVGPDRIEAEMTIEDAATLEAPLTVRIPYVRATGLDRLVHDSDANDRTVLDSGNYVIAPPREE